MYRPDRDAFGPLYTTVSYQLFDPDNSSRVSHVATVTISVRPVNDAPTGESFRVTVTNQDGPTTVTLPVVDRDENASDPTTFDPGFAPHLFAKITAFPRGGVLSQVSSDGSIGEAMDSTVAQVPAVSTYLLLTKYYVLLTTYYVLLTTYYLLLTTYYLLLTTYYLLLTTYYLLLTTYYLLLTTYYLLLTTYHILTTYLLQVPVVSTFVSEIIRYSSQFTRCDGCFVWSGGESSKTGCKMANTFAQSTCRGSACAVPFGEELR